MVGNLLGQLPVLKLQKGEYERWSIQMRTLLGAQGVWDVVEDGYEEPAEGDVISAAQQKELKEMKQRDKIALLWMFQGLDGSGFEKVADCKTAKDAWKVLENTYKGADRVRQVRLQTLRGELESMRMKGSETVTDYIGRVTFVTNQMKRNGEALTESRVCEKILRSLTDKFENVVCAIEENKTLDQLTLDELTGSLEAHEQRKVKRQEMLEEALQKQMVLKEDEALYV